MSDKNFSKITLSTSRRKWLWETLWMVINGDSKPHRANQLGNKISLV